jgi:four helix bundle protein
MEPALATLDIYLLAHRFAVDIHHMSLTLPSFERYEEATQIRRSSKRVSASIVEGFSQRKYKGQYLMFLYRALGSADETQEHLRLLRETRSLQDSELGAKLLKCYEMLSEKIFTFIRGIEDKHETPHYLQGDGPELTDADAVEVDDLVPEDFL